MGCEKPMRCRCGSSGGALCLRLFRSTSSSISISPGTGTAICGGRVRRRRRVSMLCAVRSREPAVNAIRLCSVSSMGEADAVRGTTVVVICNRGAMGDLGDTGGRHGVGWAISTFGASAVSLDGNRRRPTPASRAARARVPGCCGSGFEALAWGCSVRAGVRKDGRRMDGRAGPSCTGTATWPLVLKRAVICSREGRIFLLVAVAGARRESTLRYSSPAMRKSTCSTQGWQVEVVT